VLVLVVAVYACAIYANLSFTVTNPTNYRFFPPFRPNVNVNANRHLGGEYFNMARSLAKGEGFAHPFDRPTGPTAWQPPVLPTLLAGLLWVAGGSRDGVMALVVFFQVTILIATGCLVLALARQTTRRLGAATAAAVFLAGLLCNFSLCFQSTHDSWLVLLNVDLLLAGLCWCRPLAGWRSAAGWGLFGGLCVLINPGVGIAWGALSALLCWRRRAWSGLAVAGLAAGLTLAPWTVRNYLVFGRFIPAKSNLAYELYQSQCLQPGGPLQATTFREHPYGTGSRERQEYNALGEVAYLDRKWQQFGQAVRANPADFLRRVAERFVAVTVWYQPLDLPREARNPWALWLSRSTYPLPFLAVLVLAASAARGGLPWGQWAALAVYGLYLLPYVGVSYYERYGLPLLGVKVLLVVWGADRLLSLLPATARRPPGAPTPSSAPRPVHATSAAARL
jgi:hypothetical protein